MYIHSLAYYKRQLIGVSFIFLLTLMLPACSGGSTPTTGNGTATKATGGGNRATATVTGSPSPQVKLGTQPCPEAVKDPAHWDAIIGTQSGVSKVGRVN